MYKFRADLSNPSFTMAPADDPAILFLVIHTISARCHGQFQFQFNFYSA